MKFQFKLLASAIVEVEADTVEEAQTQMAHSWYRKGIKSKNTTFTVQHVINYNPNYPDTDFRQPKEYEQMTENAYNKAISPVSWAIIALGIGTVLAMAVFGNPAEAAYCTQYAYDGSCVQTNEQQNTVIYPTYPGSNARNYGESALGIKRQNGNITVYPTLPGSNARDYSRPGYIIDRD